MVYMLALITITSITIMLLGYRIGNQGCENIVRRVYIMISLIIGYYIYKIVYKGEERMIGISLLAGGIYKGERMTLIIDRTTTIMIIIIILIGYIIIKYSVWYIGEVRFQGILISFIGSMLIIVTTRDLLGIYVGWEIVGICSSVLINYWYINIYNNLSGMKAIVYNKVGDIGLLIAIVLIYNKYNMSSIYILTYNIESIITIGILIAAMAKSAQYIMHPWLGDAMAGPTPVSALLHAATMVTAGIILLSRTMIYKDPIWEDLLYISLITIIFGGLTSLVQNDIKKLIAYSTCSQLGYMFILLNKETPIIFSLYHLFTHAFFKALLFICAGIIIHYSNYEQDLRRIHTKNTNFLYVYLLFSSLSLLSFPFTSGYYSKESIILSTDNTYIFSILSIGALLTILYSYKLIYMIYINNNNMNTTIIYFPMQLYLYILPLLIGTVIIGYYTNEYYLSEYRYIIEHNIIIQILPIIGICIYMNRGSNRYIISEITYHMYNTFNKQTYIDEILKGIGYKIVEIGQIIYKDIDKGIIEYIGPNNIYRSLYTQNISIMSIYTKNSTIINTIVIVIIIIISLG